MPLIARGVTLGALTLCMTASGRRYDADDLALAQDLAQRQALAVDNARLFSRGASARAREAEAANRAKSEFLADDVVRAAHAAQRDRRLRASSSSWSCTDP